MADLPTNPTGTRSPTPSASPNSRDIGPEYGVVRKPKAWFIIDGVRVEPIELDVGNNAYFTADTFRARFRLDETGEMNMKKWSDQDDIDVEIYMSDGTTEKMILKGRTDDVDIDFDQRLVLISGRDLTSELIETKITEKFPNKTSSEIVAMLAARHNLTPVADKTSTRVGVYYGREKAMMTDQTTEWNLLTYLAEQEGFVLYVEGSNLHFHKPPEEANAPRWVVRYTPPPKSGGSFQMNTEFLRLRRNLTVARDVVVKVISWNSKKKQQFEVSQRADRSRRPQPRTSSPTRTFVFRIPNLTEEEASKLATKKLREVSQNERVMDIRLPGDLRVTQEHVLVLAGTGTEFDQEYLIDAITWDLAFNTGFYMRIQARNIAPTSQVAL